MSAPVGLRIQKYPHGLDGSEWTDWPVPHPQMHTGPRCTQTDGHQRQAGELRGSKKVRMLVAEGQEEPGEGQGG